MSLSPLFKKAIISGIALTSASLTFSVWTSIQHDQRIRASFLDEVFRDNSKRTITINTDGVTRQGMVIPGAAIPNISFGFYNHPSNNLVIAGSPEAACWYTNLKVVAGTENLPFWQKIFGGAEYERAFANQAFDGLWSYNCAPKP